VRHLNRELSSIINAARTLGEIRLTDEQLYSLCLIVLADLDMKHALEPNKLDMKRVPKGILYGDYYGIPLEKFAVELPNSFNLESVLDRLAKTVPDFVTYFKCLCEIHKRRTKFKSILRSQNFPDMEQIVPRSILEYKLTTNEALASWLVWRKWLYDIDNRSAQETGYMFEPILAAAIGGVQFSAKNSPVRRSGEKKRGRQVDCIEGKNAYEFKMRVTIAASGQGRFGEELDFARDCKQSGYRPILVVLDSTPSPRLKDLVSEYTRFGGLCFIGDKAWHHLEEKAGRVMSIFISKYIKKPLDEVTKSHAVLLPISLAKESGRICLKLGDQEYEIRREPS